MGGILSNSCKSDAAGTHKAAVPPPGARMNGSGSAKLTPPQGSARHRRPSIASAPTDPNAKMIVYNKSDTDKEFLLDKVRNSKHFLLKDLTAPQVTMFVDALEQKNVVEGQLVVKQGETGGEHFYLVGAGGGAEVFVKRGLEKKQVVEEDDLGDMVLNIEGGGTFGELALMYMCERQATVRAKTDCILWQIEQTQFRTMLANLQQTEKTEVKNFIKENPLFVTLNQFEMATLVDAMHEAPLSYKKDDVVITQGEELSGEDEDGGKKNGCFIIKSGSCVAIITEDGEERVVKRYGEKEHFGELALITDDAKRRATIKCTSDCNFFYISREKFESLVGPVKEILGREKDKYKSFAEGEKA